MAMCSMSRTMTDAGSSLANNLIIGFVTVGAAACWKPGQGQRVSGSLSSDLPLGTVPSNANKRSSLGRWFRLTSQLIMVYRSITKTVRRVEIKKIILLRWGSLRAAKLHKYRTRYRKNKAVRPMAASRCVPSRCLRVLMTTL